ncbi:MAG: T9SS type A sorting domain-containing protein [Saprospirales bacterium]|nr:T9SS type A sorting domain-containing protein [Saprospirales bacterium]
MKLHIYLSAFFLCFTVVSYGQTFLNGDFENTTALDCEYNMDNETFNGKMPGVTAFGDIYTGSVLTGGEADIQKAGCYVDPQNGNWCVGIAGSDVNPADGDAIALELSAPLVVGEEYRLIFYVYGNTNFAPINNLEVGASKLQTDFGSSLMTVVPDELAWKKVDFNFEATDTWEYITVRPTWGVSNWDQVDNFTISLIVNGTDELDALRQQLEISPNPFTDQVRISLAGINQIRVMDVLGRNLQTHSYKGQEEVQMDLSGLSQGMYLLEIRTDVGTVTEMVTKE